MVATALRTVARTVQIDSVARTLELTILMPCLNEAETLAVCIRKARQYLHDAGVSGEVLVADNGSTDGSVAIAQNEGARVVHVPVRGYGAALRHGMEAARGRYVIMGDADDSYDFSALDAFLNRLRAGDELVIGNRFQGGIARGAMPFLHRYLGNPVLSFLGRLFFHAPIGDFHCGLRGFDRRRILDLSLDSPGMEFASEMIVKARLHDLKISEVPTTLQPDGRSRAPHLKTWSDGWRHLKFLLVYSPRWLFLYPGIASFSTGLALALSLYAGPVSLTPNLTLDIHSLIFGCMLMLVGALGISFALIARRYAARTGMLPTSARVSRWLTALSVDRMLVLAALLFVGGTAGLGHTIWSWAQTSFGDLAYASLVKPILLSGTAVTIGLQLAFTAFFSALIDTHVGSARESADDHSSMSTTR